LKLFIRGAFLSAHGRMSSKLDCDFAPRELLPPAKCAEREEKRFQRE
jgi:hypothetical protein